MKQGELLEVTDVQERLKLLIDGAKFITTSGNLVYFSFTKMCFFEDQIAFSDIESKSLTEPWHYPAETYALKGIVLIDERIKFVEEITTTKDVFVSIPHYDSMHSRFETAEHKPPFLAQLCERNLLHRTRKAAVAHAQAMIKVAE